MPVADPDDPEELEELTLPELPEELLLVEPDEVLEEDEELSLLEVGWPVAVSPLESQALQSLASGVGLLKV